jgi:hypothetical protein
METELQTKQLEADKLIVEKAANQQRIKLLEHELSKTKKTDSGNSELTGYQKLQAEYEEVKITNTVYLEKIEELVEQINQTKDQSDRRSAELEIALETLQKQLKDHGLVSEVGRHVSDSITVKTSISKTNFGQSDDVNVLKKEIDTLKQRIVILTDKNMEYQNVLADFKNRDRSRSKNVKK